jgi:hypothetical protein
VALIEDSRQIALLPPRNDCVSHTSLWLVTAQAIHDYIYARIMKAIKRLIAAPIGLSSKTPQSLAERLETHVAQLAVLGEMTKFFFGAWPLAQYSPTAMRLSSRCSESWGLKAASMRL